ncbi:MAG: protein translocase subunit SecF [Anaerolineae bacterium]
MLNFVKYRRRYYLLSLIVIAAGIVAMVISTQTYRERSIIRLSIDFVGGAVFQVEFDPQEGVTGQAITGTEVSDVFVAAGLDDVTAQRIGVTDERWQVRANFGDEDLRKLDDISTGLAALAAAKGYAFNDTRFRENYTEVSPIIGSEVTNAAIVATLVASLVVLMWIAFAFRTIKHAFRYGFCALIALAHDILVILGAMSITGLLLGWEADALFVTAVLTVLGYSVQDSIVVFDRIRENEQRHKGEPFDLIVNRSVTETIQRSLMTQIAVGFVLVALVILTRGAIQQFVGVLLVGLLSGTYSSLFTAVPLVYSWEMGEFPFIFARKRKAALA